MVSSFNIEDDLQRFFPLRQWLCIFCSAWFNQSDENHNICTTFNIKREKNTRKLYLLWTQKGDSRDSSQASALPLDASSTSSSIESLMYSLCAKRSHSVNVGFSRSCFHFTIFEKCYNRTKEVSKIYISDKISTWRMRNGSRVSNAINLLRLNRMLNTFPESLEPLRSCSVTRLSFCGMKTRNSQA